MFGAAGRIANTAGEIALPPQVFIITEGNIGGDNWGYNLAPPMFDNPAGGIDDGTWNGAVPGTVQRVAAQHDFSGFSFWLDGPGSPRLEEEIYSIQNDGINGGVPLLRTTPGFSFLYNSFYGCRWEWIVATVDASWNGSGTQTVTVKTSP